MQHATQCHDTRFASTDPTQPNPQPCLQMCVCAGGATVEHDLDAGVCVCHADGGTLQVWVPHTHLGTLPDRTGGTLRVWG